MTPHTTPSTRHALACLLALASACAQASPNHDAPAPAQSPAPAPTKATAASPTKPPATAPAAGAAPATPDAAPPPTIDRKIQGLDTLEQLREKLSQRIGATKAVDRKSVVVMQVAAPAGNDMQVSARAASGSAAGAASARSTRTAMAARKPGAGTASTVAATAAAAAPTAWDYSGPGGPQAWATIKPEYSQCATGQRQSPIDIRDGIAVELEPVQFEYRSDSSFSVIDTGHTVQVNLPPGSAIQVLGRRYELQQFHFHRPSEERIGGRQFDMTAHLVHRDTEGRLAVVAVLLERGSVQPIVQTVWNNLPLEKHEAQAARATMDLNALLPKDRRYYTYMGSLTTPPCSEGVLWMVMQQPVAVSAEQIEIFARLYPMNARPVQNAAGRLIKQSD